jgi:hypothetical protein
VKANQMITIQEGKGMVAQQPIVFASAAPAASR